ncbi:MAG: 2,3-bisphosphoglycerate-independent phosphoglycerate mutase [Thermoanaerobacteraceae bacterium]|nr:2,3-bisphosphoglycerate-independent phosphoglycerate mutase [Thermoanaerobacteraceae bacterium]
MRKKKCIMVIGDGLGDRPIELLQGKTPLEAAKKPVINMLSSNGMTGLVHPYKPGIRVGTDVGHLCIFGYEPEKVYSGRGPIEAFSAGIELKADDVAFRANFATVSEDLTVIDRRAGRIRKGTRLLAESLNGIEIDDCKIFLKELTEHRAAVVIRGEGLSDMVTDTDPGTTHEGEKVKKPLPTENTIEAEKTTRVLWKFLMRAHEILKVHPVNVERQKNGLFPANFIITRGAGKFKKIEKITDIFKVKAACIAGDETILGIGKMCGFDVFTSSKFTGSFDTDYKSKALMVLQKINEGYDFVVVHVKATDLAGHDNVPFKKVEVIENIETIFSLLYSNIDRLNTYLCLTADHTTPYSVRDHTCDPVPAFIWGSDVRKDGIQKFGEEYIKSGSLSGYTAKDVFYTLMDFMGYTEKYGA